MELPEDRTIGCITHDLSTVMETAKNIIADGEQVIVMAWDQYVTELETVRQRAIAATVEQISK